MAVTLAADHDGVKRGLFTNRKSRQPRPRFQQVMGPGTGPWLTSASAAARGAPLAKGTACRFPVFASTQYRVEPLRNIPAVWEKSTVPAETSSCAPVIPLSGVNHRDASRDCPVRL